MRILFVEDEAYLYRSIIELLKDRDCEVIAVGKDASEALVVMGAENLLEATVTQYADAKKADLVDLIVLDVMMPTGTESGKGGLLQGYTEDDAGIGVYKLIRSGKNAGLLWAKDLRVFILTADNQEKTRKR